MTTNCFSGSHSVGRLFTLRNDRDMAVTISERAAAIVSWWAPDRYGRIADVLLAQDEQCAGHDAHGGAAGAWRRRAPQGPTCADTAADLAPARVKAVWQGQMHTHAVTLRLQAPADDGLEAGVYAAIQYRLDDEGCLSIEYEARAPVPVTIRLGAYPHFNLNGGRGDVGDHMLQIAADYYLKLDHGGVAVGVAAVGGTPFDFRDPAAIGPRLRWPDAQTRMAGGFDHCYCFDSHGASGAGALREVAQVLDPASGRRLQVSTTEAGLRFSSCGATREPGSQLSGFCLEASTDPERYPGEVLLHPGRVYRQTTVYQLSLQG